VVDPAATAAAARAVIPETADGYALNVPDNLKSILAPESLAKDPMVATIREHFKSTGRTQGEFDQLFDTIGVLQAKGFVPKPLDFAAERAALGENGAARQAEVETFAKAMKSRGDLDDAEFGELMSLAPTRAGVTLVEKLRKMTGNETVKLPTDNVEDPKAAEQKAAQAMQDDPRYQTDRKFRKAADEAYMKAF
jgi:hypothetical protein